MRVAEMKKSFSFVLVLFACFQACFSQQSVNCPEDEEYQSCGSNCPLTCENWNQSATGIACTQNCRPGCFCKSGLIRDHRSGKCVKPNLCEINCIGENQEAVECANYIQPTCENNNNNLNNIEYTPSVCLPGCACQEGFILSEQQKKCIPKTECKICGRHERHSSCISACPKTCQHPEERACIKICHIGCECLDGFIRDEETNECVKKEECPNFTKTRCESNEYYSSCARRECFFNNTTTRITSRFECNCHPGCVKFPLLFNLPPIIHIKAVATRRHH